ncbi:MAG: LacI family DNA-binding transcriptional regulator [Treponemataceae bacterium]
MSDKITLEKLSKVLGLSRNTISKALNGSPSVTPETRRRVFELAKELNYKTFVFDTGDEKTKNVVVAVLSTRSPNEQYWTMVLCGIESIIRQKNAILQLKMLTTHDIVANILPREITPDSVAGVILIGIFNEKYIQSLIGAGLTVISIDTWAKSGPGSYPYDVIMPENYHPAYSLTQSVVDGGHSELGFVGDIGLRASIRERWNGFRAALSDNGIPLAEELSITKSQYAATESCASFVEPWSRQWFVTLLPSLPRFPTAFICGDDSIALNLYAALRELGVKVPQDILITGFDAAPEATILVPRFSTVYVDKEELGRKAAETLFWRLENKDRPFSLTYISSQIQLILNQPVKND